MNRHLLYIAFWYPPSRASGVYRAVATTKAFVENGWDVTVITTSKEFLEDEVGSLDTSLLAEVPSSVDVARVPFAFDMDQIIDIRSLGWLRANFPTLWRKLHERATPVRRIGSVMAGRTEEAHPMTDRYVAWIDPVVKAGRRVHSAKHVDHVLATGNPYSSFEAARLLGGILDVGFSIDYRDPWTIDVFTGRMDHADRTTNDAEKEILHEAVNSFHVNDAIADAYRSKYPETASKHHAVYNGYDPESVPAPSGPATGPVRMGMLGTMNDMWPTRAIFEAWSDVRESFPQGSEIVLGGHLGYFERSQDLLEDELPDESAGFRYVGPVAKAAVADFYASVDVVILPVPGGPMVTSGKVFEALALGKPIVCVQKSGGGARELTDDWPLSFGADPDRESVALALLEAMQAARDTTLETAGVAQSRAQVYERSKTIQVMVDRVEEAVGARSTV